MQDNQRRADLAFNSSRETIGHTMFSLLAKGCSGDASERKEKAVSERYGRSISFTVYGEPQSKRDGQSSVAVINGRPIVHRFTPAKLRNWHDRVVDKAIEATEGMERPLFPRGAVKLSLFFVFPRPTTARKYQVSKFTKPDNDRLQCAVQDALQGIIYTTDGQIAKWVGGKDWLPGPPHVFIDATEIIAEKNPKPSNKAAVELQEARA